MAVIKKRVDDVLHAQGKDVEATETTRVVVPAVATGTGKSARLDLDVSAQGKTALAKMIRDAEAATRKAWEPVLSLKPQSTRKPKAERQPSRDERHEQPQGHPEQQRPEGAQHFPPPAGEQH